MAVDTNSQGNPNVAMTVAPDGGIALSGVKGEAAMTVAGPAYDPLGNVWHWTGRQPYERVNGIDILTSRRPDDWVPADPGEVAAAAGAHQHIAFPEPTHGQTTAEAILASEGDQYLMAVAAADKMILNAAYMRCTAQFPDRSMLELNGARHSVSPVQ